MAVEVVMPRLGWGGEDGSLVEWVKRDGDEVAVGEIICTVEGDKAVQEVESLDRGVLRIPPGSPEPGVKVPVGTVLAYLIGPGEKAPFESTRRPPPGSISISPRARRVAGELGVDWTTLAGSGRTSRIVERDVLAAAKRTNEGENGRVSAVARRVAGELGVDLEELIQAKPGTRITRADVEEAASRQRGSTGATRPRPSEHASDARQMEPAVHDVPMGTIRRIIAQRMAESARTAAPVTLTTEADATDLVRLREQLKKDRAGTNVVIPSYNDLFAKAVAAALQNHPELNASIREDRIISHASVSVGIAVDTERGLLVPVIHEVQNKSLGQIARESAPLIERARAGRATLEDLSGGTFTITNLGVYEIDAFTPIINLPEGAILGVGRIVAKPVVLDEVTETIGVRKMVALSLTFDHRLVDGAPAARFLQDLKRLIERPTLLI